MGPGAVPGGPQKGGGPQKVVPRRKGSLCYFSLELPGAALLFIDISGFTRSLSLRSALILLFPTFSLIAHARRILWGQEMPRPTKAKQSLFEDEQEETTAATRLAVNSKFAERYESKKRKQDLARARELGLDPATTEPAPSSDEESEDDGAALTADLDAQVRQTIDLIRKKDPRVYDPAVTFFPESGTAKDDADEDDGAAKKKSKKQKKVTGKDVLREQLLDAVARGAEDAFEEDDEDLGAAAKRRGAADERPAKAYDAEQEALRRAFLETVSKDAALAAADEGAGDAEGLLQERPKKKESSKKGRKAAAAEAATDEGGAGGGGEAPPLVSRDELKRHLLAKVP